MPQQSIPSRAQRSAVLVSVAVAHAMLFVLVLAGRVVVSPSFTAGGALKLVSLKAETPTQSRPPPTLPSKIAIQKSLSDLTLSGDPDSVSLAASSGSCAPLEVIAKALIADPAAMNSVINSPQETRSIADAIVMWNAGWSAAAISPDAPLGPARTIVEQSLDSIDDGCLDTPIAGPRLVPIPDGETTTFLVFGSGTWKWRELVTSANAGESLATADSVTLSILDWDWF